MADLSASQRRFLRYWALNVTLTYQSGWAWIPLFPYRPEEKQRLAELAASADRTRTVVWLAATTIVALIALVASALILGFALFGGLALIWPDPARIPATLLFAALGVLAALAIAVEIPLAITLGGLVADRFSGPPDVASGPLDATLYAKVRIQFLRLPLILAPLVLVASLIWQRVLG